MEPKPDSKDASAAEQDDDSLPAPDARLLYARLVALLLDLVCMTLLLVLPSFGFGLLLQNFEPVPIWSQAIGIGLLWVLGEAKWGHSPGQAMMGLHYAVAGSYWQRFARLLLRQGARALIIAFSVVLVNVIAEVGKGDQNRYLNALRLFLMLLVFILPHPGLYLRLPPPFSPGTAFQDWVSGVRVEFAGARPSILRLAVGTLCAIVPLWMLTMLNSPH